MPCRLDVYRRYLEKLTERHYTFLTVEDLAFCICKQVRLPTRGVLLRHDIDTDLDTARRMFRIERSLGVRSSYYFRLSTVEPKFMQEIAVDGSEVGYHFEEIATVAKQLGLKSGRDLEQHMGEIRILFRTNLQELRHRTGLPMRTVAAHGDFANRLLGIPNHQLLTPALRSELGILAETYDAALAGPLSARVSDAPPPLYWSPHDPMEAIVRASRLIYILVHPKHWRANIAVNLGTLRTRFFEGVSYWCRRRLTYDCDDQTRP